MASAPTGHILKFVEDFNKEFDKEIERLKIEVDEAKLILASVSSINQLKQCKFPDGDTSVKTIGDLYKYTYNFDTVQNLTPKVKYFSGQVDYASAEILSEFNKDIDGNTMIPKQDLKPLKRKIESGLSKLKSLNEKIELKKPQGKNPSLWSPGLYYFEYFHNSMLRYIKDKDEYHFSLDYLSALNSGKESFTFSISSFTPDGDILIKNSPFKEKGFSSRDGQAGYSVFDSILQNKMENPYYTDMRFIANIGFQDNNQMFGRITGASGSAPLQNKTPFESLKTLYLTGKVEDLKNNPKFQLTRGELSDDETFFYGNYELIGLYKAFLQAGDNYEPVTIPFTPPPDKSPVEEKKPDVVPSNPTQSTDSTSATASNDKIYTFDVQDPQMFLCLDPKMELYLILPKNEISTYRNPDGNVVPGEEILEDEYREIEVEEEIKMPEMVDLDLNIKEPFIFDKTDLQPEAEKQLNEFIEKVNKYYKGVKGDVEVVCSSSIDNDPEFAYSRDLDKPENIPYRTETEKTGSFKKKRKEWDKILSDNRAIETVKKIKEKIISDVILNFIPKGVGQTSKYGPSYPNPDSKTDGKHDKSKTSPNRRLMIVLPKIKIEKQGPTTKSSDLG